MSKRPITQDTEDDFISTIPGLEEYMTENANTQETDNTQATADTQESNTNQSSGSVTENVEGTEQSAGRTDSTQTNSNEPTNQTVPRRDGLVEVPNKDNPRSRDLVDPTTGRVVAHGGIERHVFENAQRHRRENEALRQQLTLANNQIQGVNETTRLASQLQLQPQEQIAALQAMAEFKRDPVRFLEQMVAEVKAKGFSLPFLEEGVSAGIDTAAINRLLDDRLAPITNAQRQQEEMRALEAQANQTLDNFLNAHPEVQANLDVIGQMITHDPSLTLDTAYIHLLRWCSSNGLDSSQSIRTQLAERAARNQQPQQGPPTQQAQHNGSRSNTTTAPLPMSGRSANGSNTREAAPTFDESSSWRDMIRQSMKESNYAP